jgi:class 3 adenylate cyclase
LHVLLLACCSSVRAQQYQIRTFGIEDGLPGSTVLAIAQDTAGFLWVDTDAGLSRFDGRFFHTWMPGEADPTLPAGEIRRTPDGRIQLRRSQASGGSIAEAQGRSDVRCEVLDTISGQHWIGGLKGVRVYRGMADTEPCMTLGEANGLGADVINWLFRDRSGIMWIGTQQGGLSRFTGDALRWYGRDGGPLTRCAGLCATGTERVYGFGIAGGMEVHEAGRVSRSELNEVLTCAVVGPGGHIHVGSDRGVLTLTDASNVRGIREQRTDRLLPELQVTALAAASNALWVGHTHGLMQHRDGLSVAVGRDTLYVTALCLAGDSMLIGTHRGLYAAPLDNSSAQWRLLVSAGLEDITCLAYDRAGNTWIGTADRGLVRYDPRGTTRWTTRDRLAGDHVRQLLLDAYQNLWVGTDRGFNLLELDELQEQVIAIRSYGLEDGFPGIEAMPNACALAPDTALWFGTTRGTVRFDPRKVLEDPVPPHTRITDLAIFFEHPDLRPWCDSIDADGLPLGLRLPHTRDHLTFTFTGLSLAYPEKVRFQYKLEGQDADWSPITASDRVTYTDLEPGSYTFLVKARNGSGLWNDEPARFSFTITPPFWDTWGFKGGGAVMVLVGLFGLQRLRERRTRMAQARLEHMVEQRTQELADEKHRSEALLLNILPETTAAELKERGTAQARHYDECTVLFSDFQGFTALSEQLESTGIVNELDRFFRAFDRITDIHGIEKIKTIGDAYMCASGVPLPRATHVLDAVLMGLAMLDVVDNINAARQREGHPAWPIRIGLHSGPLIAGVVGEKKFAYDVWGDTVNLASRMESSGAAGRLHVTRAVIEQVGPYVVAEARGTVNLKGKGDVESWFIDRLRPEFSADRTGRKANTALMVMRTRQRT